MFVKSLAKYPKYNSVKGAMEDLRNGEYGHVERLLENLERFEDQIKAMIDNS